MSSFFLILFPLHHVTQWQSWPLYVLLIYYSAAFFVYYTDHILTNAILTELFWCYFGTKPIVFIINWRLHTDLIQIWCHLGWCEYILLILNDIRLASVVCTTNWLLCCLLYLLYSNHFFCNQLKKKTSINNNIICTLWLYSKF